MTRRITIVAALFGLTSVAGLWAFAVWVAVTHEDRASYTVGYAHGESWLLGAVVYPDGYVFASHYEPNLTLHDGFYAKLSRERVRHRFTLASVIPRRIPRNRFSPASGVIFHLGPPLLIFLIWSGFLILLPILRTRRRRKHGLCVACGFDMRGATSLQCTECGTMNSVPSPNLAKPNGAA